MVLCGMLILLVEDSEEVREISLEYLQELGHQAIAVSDAEEALDKMQTQSFDVLIADISLPGISGIDLAKKLRGGNADLPIILCTGYTASRVRGNLGDLVRSVQVLTKPYDLPALASALAKAVRLGSG